MFGAIKLLGNQSPIPGQDRIGFGYASNLVERFASKPLSDFAEGDSLRVRKPQSPRQLGSQDPILSGQVFVPQEQLLIHRTANVSQQSQPSTVPHADRLSYCVADGLSSFTIRAQLGFSLVPKLTDHVWDLAELLA